MAQTLRLFLRNKTWWVSGTFNGERVRESTGHSDKGKAQSWTNKRAAEIDLARQYGPEAVFTFGAAMSLYLETERDHRFLHPLLDEWERKLLKDIHPGDVVDLANRLYPTASGATKNRQVITPVVAIFRHAAKRGKCAPLIVERFPVKRIVKRKTATWEWVASFIKVAKPKLVALCLFLPATGARISDALKLDWADVDLKTGSVLLRDTKNGEDRLVRLVPDALAAVKALHRPSSKGKVFQFYDKSDVRRQIITACGVAGIDYVPTHGIGRRLFATTMQRKGVDPKTAATAGGWKSVRMYSDIYAQPDDPDQAIKSAIGTELSQALRKGRKNPRQRKAKE